MRARSHGEPFATRPPSPRASARFSPSSTRRRTRFAEDVCPQATEELRGRCRLEEVLQPGDAVENILRAAHMGDYDLVVMGVEPKSSLWGELVSSTTERVMRVLRKPLLIVPNPFKEESS